MHSTERSVLAAADNITYKCAAVDSETQGVVLLMLPLAIALPRWTLQGA